MRSKTVTINNVDVNIQEKRIGELEQVVADLFPGSGGNVGKIDLAKFAEQIDFDLLYEKLPAIFPGLSRENVKNAYMSELEALLEAFVDVNFFGLKRLIRPLLNLAQAGTTPKP